MILSGLFAFLVSTIPYDDAAHFAGAAAANYSCEILMHDGLEFPEKGSALICAAAVAAGSAIAVIDDGRDADEHFLASMGGLGASIVFLSLSW